MSNEKQGFFLTPDEQQQSDDSLNIEAAARERGDWEGVRRQRERRARLLSEANERISEANERKKRKADTE